MDNQTVWTIKKTEHLKFPFHLTISKGKETLLDLFVQDCWPGTKGNIFCIQAKGRESISGEETEVERIPVLNFSHFGKRLTVILDRPTKKRCSFLFLVRSYKTKEGEYEQIFWQTQQGLEQRKTRYKFTYYRKQELKIFIDSAERYAWNFPVAETVKEKLPIGDYAIKDKFGFLAFIERKTFSNLMGEFGNLKKFHQNLSELEACKNAILVVEASYGDFLNRDKIRPYSGNFGAKAIAEIQAMHPKLPVVFAGSRKMGEVFAGNYFEEISAKNSDYTSNMVRESAAKYGENKTAVFSQDQIRRTVFSAMPETFSFRMMKENLPEIAVAKIRNALAKLENEGVLRSEKKGRSKIWRKSRGDN